MSLHYMPGTVYCEDTKTYCVKEASVYYKDKHYSLRRLGPKFGYCLREDGKRINVLILDIKADLVVESLWFYGTSMVGMDATLTSFVPFASIEGQPSIYTVDFKHRLMKPEDFTAKRRKNLPPRTSYEIDVQVESTLGHLDGEAVCGISATTALSALSDADLQMAATRIQTPPGSYIEIQAIWHGWSLDMQALYPSPMSNDREPDVLNWRYTTIPKV